MIKKKMSIILVFGSIFMFVIIPFIIFLAFPSFFTSEAVNSSKELKRADFNSVISDVKFERGISMVVDSAHYYFGVDYNAPKMYLPESYFMEVIKKGEAISKKSGDNFFVILNSNGDSTVIYFR